MSSTKLSKEVADIMIIQPSVNGAGDDHKNRAPTQARHESASRSEQAICELWHWIKRINKQKAS